MFQKFFGGMFGSSSQEGRENSSKDQTSPASPSSSSAHGSHSPSSRAHGHKHKHLRAQRGLKPYHNSQAPDVRGPEAYPRISDVASTVSVGSTRDGPRSPTSTTGNSVTRAASSAALDGINGTPCAASLTRPLQTEVYQRDEAPFLAAMARDTVDLAALRTLSWHGSPVSLRCDVWMLLTGHWHPVKSLREGVRARKRQEYKSYVQGNYNLVDWDAVCALADCGKDGASVRRSTLLSQHPQRRAGVKGLPARGLGTAGHHDAHSRSPHGDAGGDIAGLSDSRTNTPPHLARPRPSYSSLDLMALEDGPPPPRRGPTALTRAPSLDANAHTVAAEDGPLLKDMSIVSAPATLSTEREDVDEDAEMEQEEDALKSAAHDDSVTRARHVDCASPDDKASRPVSPTATLSPRSPPQTADSPSDASPKPPTAARESSSPDAFQFPAPTASSPSSSLTGAPSHPPRRTTPGPRVSLSTMVSSKEMQILKQIRKDVPRMSGGTAYLQHPRVQGMVERILFTWSLRHPACGYVQGMNDLLLPFVSVTLAKRFCPTCSISELRAYDTETVSDLLSETAVPADQWVGELEADIYWCASYFLNGMQDNYTQNQTGIYQMCERLRQVIHAADPKLYMHLVETLQLNFVQFSFRWMNCMLMRELTETQQLRLLDAYLSDQERRWSVTHVYVCAALLLRWSKPLLQMQQFVDAARYLQAPPTASMTPREMDDVLSEAFVLENLYDAGLQNLQAPRTPGEKLN